MISHALALKPADCLLKTPPPTKKNENVLLYKGNNIILCFSVLKQIVAAHRITVRLLKNTKPSARGEQVQCGAIHDSVDYAARMALLVQDPETNSTKPWGKTHFHTQPQRRKRTRSQPLINSFPKGASLGPGVPRRPEPTWAGVGFRVELHSDLGWGLGLGGLGFKVWGVAFWTGQSPPFHS